MRQPDLGDASTAVGCGFKCVAPAWRSDRRWSRRANACKARLETKSAAMIELRGGRCSTQPNPSPTQERAFNTYRAQGCRDAGRSARTQSPRTRLPSRRRKRRSPSAGTAAAGRLPALPPPSLPGGTTLQAVSCASTAACVAVVASPSSLATVAEGVYKSGVLAPSGRHTTVLQS